MRTILAALALIVFGTAAQAQTIANADITAAGIYKLGKRETIKDPSISTGQRTEAKPTLIKATTVIPAKLHTAIGVNAVFHGRSRDSTVAVRIVWRYPQPGLRNPSTGVTKQSDDYITTARLDMDQTFYWFLDSDWTLVPGEWTIEIYDNHRLLAQQSFTLVKD